MKNKTFNEKRFFTTSEIGKIFGVTRICVYKWIKEGKLPAIRIPGGKYRVLKKDLIEFIKKAGKDKYLDLVSELVENKKILIVDDDKKILDVLKEYIENKNPDFKIYIADNGFDAGSIITRIHPDIVILDLLMPGMDGFEVCRKIKIDPSTENIKVIAMTGYPDKKNIEKIKKAGADYILEKPIDFKKLEKLIER